MYIVERVTGVNWHRVKGKWQIRLRKGGKRILTGFFDDEEAGARAYDAYVLSLSLCEPGFT